ncbi:hypothetical protein ID866_6191 [Astraeus odoratus]|nr:hypothetical protein ID866_6191 [Astraeus odoratus]
MNPFRSSPPPIPSISAPQRSPSPPLPPLPPSQSPSEPGPSSARTPSPPPRPTSTSNHRSVVPLEEDLPPAYTPAADVALGEATIEVGPPRPFQPPPAHPAVTPHPTGTSIPGSLQPPPLQTNHPPWHQAPGRAYHSSAPAPSPYLRPQSTGPPWNSPATNTYPGFFGYQKRSQGGGGLIGALIDTVRDVVDVVSGAHDERMLAAQQASVGAYAPSYPVARGSNGPQYAAAVPATSTAPEAHSPPSPNPNVPDDGTPTTTPVPGHPLLKDGMLLVYPRDYLCPKCRNTGYKDDDPSHPCRKCWDKYGKPYTGALTYTPWSDARDSRTSRMQRPLPRHPRLRPQPMPSSSISCSANVRTCSASTRSSSTRMGCIVPPPHQPTSHTRSVSQPALPVALQPTATGPTYYVHNPTLEMGMSPPVPHAQPVPPGDSRLGGRLCYKCGGSGMKVYMLIDLTTCPVCGGVGRVWT